MRDYYLLYVFLITFGCVILFTSIICYIFFGKKNNTTLMPEKQIGLTDYRGAIIMDDL